MIPCAAVMQSGFMSGFEAEISRKFVAAGEV